MTVYVTIRTLALVIAGVTTMNSQGIRMIEYDIDGTAKYADVTWNNSSGSTEQKQFKLPVHEQFLGPVGMLAYVSAQKVRVLGNEVHLSGARYVLSDGVNGTIHVTLRVGQRPAGEATADAPYGIAKASAKVE